MLMRATTLESKLARVGAPTEQGCTEWQGPRDWDGYGLVGHRGRSYRVHRVIYEMHYGVIPRGLVVRHFCDNPPCVNPAHLLVGTVRDNNLDRETRGRSADRRGEKCPTAKLTWDSVRQIRTLVGNGRSHASVAADFGVTRECVSRIHRRETWKEAAQ